MSQKLLVALSGQAHKRRAATRTVDAPRLRSDASFAPPHHLHPALDGVYQHVRVLARLRDVRTLVVGCKCRASVGGHDRRRSGQVHAVQRVRYDYRVEAGTATQHEHEKLVVPDAERGHAEREVRGRGQCGGVPQRDAERGVAWQRQRRVERQDGLARAADVEHGALVLCVRRTLVLEVCLEVLEQRLRRYQHLPHGIEMPARALEYHLDRRRVRRAVLEQRIERLGLFFRHHFAHGKQVALVL